jgi:hypothetical protein
MCHMRRRIHVCECKASRVCVCSAKTAETPMRRIHVSYEEEDTYTCAKTAETPMRRIHVSY